MRPMVLLYVGEKPLCWRTCCLAATLVSSGSLLVMNSSLRKPFVRVGVAPLTKWQRVRALLQSHINKAKRNEMKWNDTGD